MRQLSTNLAAALWTAAALLAPGCDGATQRRTDSVVDSSPGEATTPEPDAPTLPPAPPPAPPTAPSTAPVASGCPHSAPAVGTACAPSGYAACTYTDRTASCSTVIATCRGGRWQVGCLPEGMK